MKFRNKSGVRLSVKVSGRKSLLFIDAGQTVELSEADLASMKSDNIVLDSYLEVVKDEPKPAKMEQPKADVPKEASKFKKK